MIRGLLVAMLALEPANAFFASPVMKSTAAVRHSRSRDMQLSVGEGEEGLHGQGSRFMSLSQLIDDEYMPRIIQIAGIYPGITAEELMAPMSTAAAEPGRWAYDFSDPDGPQTGTVALPGSELVNGAIDPVVVIASNVALGIPLYDKDIEVLVLIDRADQAPFDPRKFFAFAAPDGSVTIRWFDQVPAGYSILGRVLYTTLPHLPEFGSKKSGFMEEDE